MSPESEAAGWSGQLPGVRILVVEDDPDTCEMLEFALRRYGADVVAVNSASEALASIADRCPDILLADINMPDEDGYSLIRKIRCLPESTAAEMVAVAVTALARPEDAERAAAAGFDAHLAKPIEISELSASIKELISKRPGRGSPAKKI